ncbi:MAG: TlpA family protein disulfide reductase [Anaerolineaceae bacterium]
MFKKTLIPVLITLFVLSACAPAQAKPAAIVEIPLTGNSEEMEKPTEVMMEKPTEAMMEKPTEVMMEKPTEAMMEKPTETMMEKPTEAMMEKPAEAMGDEMMASPAWMDAALTHVSTGEAFKISDFKGKVVLVENLAIWCSTCLSQQKQVKALREALRMDRDYVSVGLDIDPNEDAGDLKSYTGSNGFDWYYAVAPKEVASEIGNLYGAQFLNPPSAPILIIDRKGEVHPMPFGLKSANDLKKFIEPFLNDSM